MKKSLKVIILVLTFAYGMSQEIFSSVNFGSKNSKFRILAGASLNVSSSNFIVDGTISEDVSSSISGNKFEFNAGILEQNNVEVFLNAQFDPTAGDSINLTGAHFATIEPGMIVKDLTVSGINNRLEGQPRFTNIITFADINTELNIGIQNVLNKSISLNSGRLGLIDNLALADDVQINGPGIVQLNDRRLSFGGFYENSWSTNLTFSSATDIVLNGDIVLTNNWTFTGTNRINGNGQIIDFSSGGTITIEPGSLLYLDNVYIKGFGDSDGKFVWSDTSSELHLGGETVIELVGDFHQLQGKVFIDGHTTFLLKNFSWFFEYPNAHLIVNDRLWLDICLFNFGTSYISGQVRASRPLFRNHVFDYTTTGTVIGNVNLDLADGTFAIGPNGVVKEVTDRSVDLVSDEEVLLSGNICQDLTLTRNVSVPCGLSIKFSCATPLVLDGCGSSITFSDSRNPDGTVRPQFIVEAGSHVILQNITLTKMYAGSIDIQPGGTLAIGQNVHFELCEDVTIKTGMISVLPSAGVWTITGICGNHQFNLLPSDPNITVLMDLDSSSLLLQNIQFNGLEFALYTSSASLVLGGDGSVGLNQDTFINFDVEGIDNELVLRADQLNLSGTIAFFGTDLKNALCIRTAFNGVIQDKPGVRRGNVLLNLLGDSTIFLTSDSNLAELQFADANISLFLGTSNSFIIDQNSILGGNRIEILNFPIKQMSARFTLDVIELTGEGIDPSFVRGGNIEAQDRVKTAFGQERQKQTDIRNKKLQEIAQVPQRAKVIRHQKFSGPQSKKNKKQKNQTYFAPRYNLELLDFEELDQVTRAVNIPVIPYDVIYEDMRIAIINPIQGAHIKVKNAEILNFFNQFGVSALPFTMDMLGEAVLEQSFDGNKDVVLETGIHLVNVQGRGNKITVTGNWTFGKDTLLFDEESELTVEVLEDATLTFEEGFSLDIEKESCLIFAGLGEVIFPRGTVFNLKGERASDIDTMILRHMKSKTSERCDIISELEEIPTLGPVVNRAKLLFEKSVIATVASGSDMVIKGFGLLIIDEASLRILSNGLVIAPNTSDDINVEITGTGRLEILDGGRVSTGLGTTSWDINRDGNIDIFGGILEFNSIEGVPMRGCVRDLEFTSGGRWFLRHDGRIILGQNHAQSSTRAFEKEFNFSLMPAGIGGSGLIEFVGRANASDQVFTGRFRIPQLETFEDPTMTFEKLAIFLTQTIRTLVFSTVYSDENGAIRVRTKTGVSSAPLNSGDVIIREELRKIQGVQRVFVIGQTLSGQLFEINEAGMRS